MSRMLSASLSVLLVTSCASSQIKRDVGTPAKPTRVADVDVEIPDLLPGWMRVSDEKLVSEHNAVYRYACETSPGQVLVETLVDIDVYLASQVTPRYLCHKSAEEVDKDRNMTVLVAMTGMRCTMFLLADGVAMGGVAEAFYASDMYVVHVFASWPRDSHEQRYDEYKRLVDTLLFTTK